MKTTEFEFKQRLRKTLKKYGITLAIGFTYLFITLFTGFGIPCTFNKLTGLQCPGCGVTRMCKSIARFNFKAAFGYNPFLFITSPLIVAYLVYYESVYVKSGSRPDKKWDIFVIAEIILGFIYGILRNIFPI